MNRKLDKKKYWILMPPFAITALLLAAYLPDEKRVYSFLVIIAFWFTYYTWKYIDKDKNKQ
ncbi:hypothetical protein [Niallia taxi]|nr:hypothetical protein [Niallia taxi]MCT2345594.1 hypothetical protein [Niallia taxi]MDE5054201.1 hypothetical protein [Niallia taxi]